VAAVLALVASLAIAWRAQSHTTTTASDPSSSTPATTTSTKPPIAAADRPLSWTAARQSLNTLRVLPRRPYEPGYQRDCGQGKGCVFGPAWTDDQNAPEGHNGCRTRDDVLRASLTDAQLKLGSRCIVVAGTLRDPYTGSMIHFEKADADAVEIDHVAALAYVWDLGANRWSSATRVAFANDPLELVAASRAANQAKGDDGPAQWLPPARSYRCDYAARFVSVLDKYRLPVVAADAGALSAVLGDTAACR